MSPHLDVMSTNPTNYILARVEVELRPQVYHLSSNFSLNYCCVLVDEQLVVLISTFIFGILFLLSVKVVSKSINNGVYFGKTLVKVKLKESIIQYYDCWARQQWKN